MISFKQCFPKRILCHAKAVHSSFMKKPQPENQSKYTSHCIKTLTPNVLTYLFFAGLYLLENLIAYRIYAYFCPLGKGDIWILRGEVLLLHSYSKASCKNVWILAK